MEMTYRNWAVASKKDWLPKEGQPFVILEDLPDGTPSQQRPDNNFVMSTNRDDGGMP